MANAKEELLAQLKDKSPVKCASIQYGPDYDPEYPQTQIILKLNWSTEDWYQFLALLDFNYNNGYGGQNLFGIVWLTDGTWLSRGEYDGSEWWEYNVLPEIPDECK